MTSKACIEEFELTPENAARLSAVSWSKEHRSPISIHGQESVVEFYEIVTRATGSGCAGFVRVAYTNQE